MKSANGQHNPEKHGTGDASDEEANVPLAE